MLPRARLWHLVLPWFSTTFLVMAVGACKKEVSGPATSRTLGNQEGAQEGDAKVGTEPSISGVSARQDDLDRKIEDEIAARMKEDAAIRLDMDEVKKRLSDLEKSLRDEIARLDAKDKSIDDEIAKLKTANQNFDQFIVFANSNFATKSELGTLAEVVGNLSATMGMLQGNVADLDKKLNGELAAVRDEMAKNIQNVRDDVQSVRQELKGQIQLFASTYGQLLVLAYTQLQVVQAEVNRIGYKVDNKLTVALANLNGRVTDLEGFRSSITTELNNKFAALDAKDAQLSQAVRDAKAEAKSDLDKAMADEKAQRNVLALKVDEMQKELARVAQAAEQATRMAETNARDIVALRDDLAAARREFASQIDALRRAFDDKLAEVKRLSVNVTINLGVNIQQQFVALNGNLADVEQKAAQILVMISQLFVDVLATPAERNAFDAAMRPAAGELTGSMGSLTDYALQVEKTVIDAFDPVLNKGGVNNAALNQSFKSLANACPNEPAFNDYYASVQSREWFFHLARAYTYQLLFGARTGQAEKDKIFFARAPYAGHAMGSLLLAGLLPPYAAGASRSCLIAVESWSRDLIFGDSEQALALRQAITRSTSVSQAVIALFAQVERLDSAAKAYFQILLTALNSKLGGEVACMAYLTKVQDEGWTLLSRLAKMFVDRSYYLAMARDLRADRERIYELARRTRANEDQITQLTNTVDQLGHTIDRETAKLTEAQRNAFNLIAAIAGRLGYDDLVTKASEAAGKIGGSIDASLQNLPAQCMAAQHFYNHATDPQLPVMRCESYMSVYGREPLDANALTRCAVHGGWYQNNELQAYTWGNSKLVNSGGWEAQGQVSGGQKVGDGLLIRPYEPSAAKAKELALRAAGSAYPPDRESTFMLRVLGAAHSFRIDVTSMTNPTQSPYSVTVNAAEFQVSGGNNKLVYEIPLPKAIAPLGACRWDREIRVTALDKAEKAAAEVCVHRFHTFSPLVFNFSTEAMLSTENPLTSRAYFDLDANGQKEHTGWIKPGQALLARDVNGNGVIDDGSELFGEATLLPNGERAANGYAALAALDADGDGFITARDPAWPELVLWFNQQQDGVSRPYEWRRLDDLGITAIAVDYETVDAARQLDHQGLPEGNVVMYQSRFFGPEACGHAGCRSFDVYFGATESFTTRQAK